jgi:hypothetical protein
VQVDKLIHQPHLENFFDAIRGKAKLNCPAEVGYETAVTVLKVNEAAEAGRRLEFKPGEFVAWGLIVTDAHGRTRAHTDKARSSVSAGPCPSVGFHPKL